MTLSSDFQKLYVDGLITLFELDASSLGAGILRFHGHISFKDDFNGWSNNIIWQGETFEPMALQADGLEMRSDGKASSPTLAMANNIAGIQGAVSAYCLQFDDFAGAKLKVITTLDKYLDAENFSSGNPTAANESKTQLWFIEQKTSENAQQVTFELSNPIDFEGLKIPVRNISGYCHWCAMGDYRGEECKFTNAVYFTDKNEATDNPALDRCRGDLKACRLRGNETNFGGFVASNMFG